MNTVEKAKEMAILETKKYGVPIADHFDISEKKALELANLFGADKDVILLGIYLMDLKLGQSIEEGNIDEHVKMGIEAAKDFLSDSDMDEERTKKVINCIESHRGRLPFVCKEAEICANAVCYRFLHPKGFMSYMAFLGKKHKDIFELLDELEKSIDDKYSLLSLDICKKELEEYYNDIKGFIGSARMF